MSYNVQYKTPRGGFRTNFGAGQNPSLLFLSLLYYIYNYGAKIYTSYIFVYYSPHK